MNALATDDLDLMVALHQASRDRKGLSSDEGALNGFSVSCCRRTGHPCMARAR